MEHFVESLQMTWGGFFWEGSDFNTWSSDIYQYGRKPPYVQFIGGQAVFFTLGAVVELILPQLLLRGEGLQTRVQVDGLCLFPPAILHTVMVLIKLLQGTKSMYFVILLFNMYIYIIITVFTFLLYIIIFLAQFDLFVYIYFV